MKINFVSEDKWRITGTSRYETEIYNFLKKKIDIETVTIQPGFIPKLIHQLTKKFGFDVETTWKNYPLYLNFKKTERGKKGIWHFSHQQQAFLLNYIGPTKKVITVHDIIPLNSKYGLSSTTGQFLFKLAARSIKKSDRIIADSLHTKKDIINSLGINHDKIDVVHLGVNPKLFFPLKNIKKEEATFLYVGSEMPRKNLKILLKALSIVKQKIPKVKLRKVGEPQWPQAREKLCKQIKELSLNENVQFVGKIKDLKKEYCRATAFVFPSLYEGFGLPVLEAMACGCPVISSNSSSLPEVGGNAVLYFDPTDAEELAEKMHNVLTDENLRKSLIKKGLKRAKQFTWEKTAKKTIQTYKKILEEIKK